MEAFLIHLGLDPANCFAAFAGSVCTAFAPQGSRPTFLGVMGSIVVGTGVGSYGGPVLPTYIDLKPNGFMTFIVGAAGLPILIMSRALLTKTLRLRLSMAEKKLEPGE
jgi:hypothetical protein